MPKLVIIMGVCGTGKTSVGRHLNGSQAITFKDGDDLHSPANKAKMDADIPLEDEDRIPWLNAICDYANSALENEDTITVACSALKAGYRDLLRKNVTHPVWFLFLHGDSEVIASRLEKRENHYMKPGMLESQLDTLEDPTGEPNVLKVDIDQSLDSLLESTEKIVQALV